MGKFRLLLVMALLSVGLSGCQNDSPAYKSAVSAGVTTAAKGNFQKAEAYFEMALSEKPEDETAKDYLEQVAAISKSQRQLSAGQLSQSRETVAALLKRNDLSRVIRQKAQEQSEEVKGVQQETDAFSGQLTEITKLMDENNYEEALNKWMEARNAADGKPALKEERGELDKILKRLVRQKSTYDVANKVAELTPPETEETQTPLIPEILQGHWYSQPPAEDGNFAGQTPALTITKDSLLFTKEQRIYQITATDHWQSRYTLSWDMNAFSRRYGAGSLGENPVPFQFYLTAPTEEVSYTTLIWLEQTFYR